MSKKHRYSSQDVEKFDVKAILGLLIAGCIVAVDVAKTDFYAGIATLTGDVVRIVRFQHPKQTRVFLGLLEQLRSADCPPQVVMEPTGSYGDALRHHCHSRGFPVFMTSPKHTHDMAEVIDGVPSMHDAKSTVVLAKLHAIRPGRQWQPESEHQRELRSLVDRRQMYAGMTDRLWGRLEGLLARFWPELEGLYNIRKRRSWMPLLIELPGPQMVAEQPDKARKLLHAASRAMVSSAEIETLVSSAGSSLGVPMTCTDQQQLSELVTEMHKLTRDVDRLDAALEKAIGMDRVVPSPIVRTLGVAAIGAIIAYLGSPADYHSAAALEKAAGLNLKVKSSGKYSGQLKITKRGPGIVRRLLHMASLRLLQDDPAVGAWYRERKAFQAGVKLKAVTAVTRKLIRAVWHMTRTGEPFDSAKLFDMRRLKVSADTPRRPSDRLRNRTRRTVTQATRLAPAQAGA